MRTGSGSGTDGLLWLFGDHLGSTSAVANADGSAGPTQLCMPWGEKRPAGASSLPTTFRFTGQRQESGLGPSGGEGLYYYGARWYDPALGRFVQPDTIIPESSQGIQAWDRYAGMNHNPVRYNDPSGHHALPPTPQPGGIAISSIGPDYRGLDWVEKNMNPKEDDIYVAAGMAVQAQYHTFLDDIRIRGDTVGYGPANVSNKQMNTEYGLPGLDQTKPKIAVMAMEKGLSLCRMHAQVVTQPTCSSRLR